MILYYIILITSHYFMLYSIILYCLTMHHIIVSKDTVGMSSAQHGSADLCLMCDKELKNPNANEYGEGGVGEGGGGGDIDIDGSRTSNGYKCRQCISCCGHTHTHCMPTLIKVSN